MIIGLLAQHFWLCCCRYLCRIVSSRRMLTNHAHIELRHLAPVKLHLYNVGSSLFSLT